MIDRSLVFMGMRCGCEWCQRRRDWAGLDDKYKRLFAVLGYDPTLAESIATRPEGCKEAGE